MLVLLQGGEAMRNYERLEQVNEVYIDGCVGKQVDARQYQQ
jgi:hypothetical protein